MGEFYRIEEGPVEGHGQIGHDRFGIGGDGTSDGGVGRAVVSSSPMSFTAAPLGGPPALAVAAVVTAAAQTHAVNKWRNPSSSPRIIRPLKYRRSGHRSSHACPSGTARKKKTTKGEGEKDSMGRMKGSRSAAVE